MMKQATKQDQLTAEPNLAATIRTTPFYARWLRAYVAWASGEGMTESGRTFTLLPRAPLAGLLAAIPDDVRVVYLVGTLPRPHDDSIYWTPNAEERRRNGYMNWCLSSPGDEWAQDAERQGGHYLDAEQPTSSVLRLRHLVSGRPLDIRAFETWGTDGKSPDVARRALLELEILLRSAWRFDEVPRDSAILLGTAAMTGARLWRSCIPEGQEWPILEPDERRFLRSISGQGRVEVFAPPHDGATIDHFCILDGRLMYGASMASLGTGPLQHDSEPTYAPYTNGFYRVRVTIPREWSHVGLVPVKDEAAPGKHWMYPSERGATFETWCGARELLTALWPFPHRCSICAEGHRRGIIAPCPEHGWMVRILERLLLTGQPKADPLRLFHDRLIRCVEQVQRRQDTPLSARMPRSKPVSQEATELDRDVRHVVSRALRAILIGTIGTFHRSHRPRMRCVSAEAAGTMRLPSGVRMERFHDANGEEVYTWKEPAPLEASLGPDAVQTMHPEWSATIYERTRAKLLLSTQDHQHVGMLTLPREQLIGVQTDALYLTANPDWPDPGSVGSLRLKGERSVPMPWPSSLPELQALVRTLEAEGV